VQAGGDDGQGLRCHRRVADSVGNAEFADSMAASVVLLTSALPDRRAGREGAGTTTRREKEAERCWKGVYRMRTYERPTLTKAGSFKKVTGLGGRGPRDPIAKHQQL
jgi:Family of unknown function (DUF5972)